MRERNETALPSTLNAARIAFLILILLNGLAAVRALADDWGGYQLTPASAPAMVVEAVDARTSDETLVSIAKPAGTANQKWYITPKEGDFYSIRPGYGSNLVLAAAKGGANNSTAIVLEADKGQPWQQWAINKDENGIYGLIPRYAGGKGLDDFGGKQNPGARLDLWTYTPGDPHL